MTVGSVGAVLVAAVDWVVSCVEGAVLPEEPVELLVPVLPPLGAWQPRLKTITNTNKRHNARFFMAMSSWVGNYLTAMASISTLAPLGTAATWKAARAGKGASKNSAYTAFIAANSLISANSTVVLTTSFML